MLQVLRSSSQHFPLSGSVVTIGNFDGIHLGHQAIITRVCAKAKELNVPAIVVLFEPQPQEFFHAHAPKARLMRLREKIAYLQHYPLDYVYCLHFHSALAAMPATEFIHKILVTQLRVQHLLIGSDFRFGYGRHGNLATLEHAGQHYGFDVEVAETVMRNNLRISSTLIRELLAAGNLSLAREYLGRPYSMIGRVKRGLQLGTALDCPTANMAILRKASPLSGIYVVQVHYYHNQHKDSIDKKGYELLGGVACLGQSPMVNRQETLLEVHLFDFNKVIYGDLLQVFFLHKLRDEEMYDSMEALKQQIAIDVVQAKEFLGPVCNSTTPQPSEL